MQTAATDVAVLKQMIATGNCVVNFAFEYQSQTFITALGQRLLIGHVRIMSAFSMQADELRKYPIVEIGLIPT
jgi:hypothetical protein